MKNQIIPMLAMAALLFGVSVQAKTDLGKMAEEAFVKMANDGALANLSADDVALLQEATLFMGTDAAAQYVTLGGIWEKVKDVAKDVGQGTVDLVKNLGRKAKEAFEKMGITKEELMKVPKAVMGAGTAAVKTFVEKMRKTDSARDNLDDEPVLMEGYNQRFLPLLGLTPLLLSKGVERAKANELADEIIKKVNESAASDGPTK